DGPLYIGEEATHRSARHRVPAADEDAVPTSAPGKPGISRVADTKPSPRPAAAPPLPKTPAPAVRPAGGEDHTASLVHDRLIEAMDLRRLDLDALGSQQLREKTESTLRQIVGKMD